LHYEVVAYKNSPHLFKELVALHDEIV
jgi:hypothetical protein